MQFVSNKDVLQICLKKKKKKKNRVFTKHKQKQKTDPSRQHVPGPAVYYVYRVSAGNMEPLRTFI